MILALILAELSDLLTFICAVSVLPISGEMNPIIRRAYEVAGIWGVVDLKIIGTAALILILYRARWHRVLGILIIGMALAGAFANTLSVALS